MLSLLLLMVSEENKSKITELYETYHTSMLIVAKNKLKCYGLRNYNIDAEDVVQNAFLKISKYVDTIKFDVPERCMRAYVLSIVSNESVNMAKRNRYYEDIDNLADELTDDEFIDKIHIREAYDETVEKIKNLEEIYSAVIFMYYFYEIPVKDIAKLFDVPVKTVYTRLSRAKILLIKEMKEWNNG